MNKPEWTVPLGVNPHFFIGRKAAAVMFGDERVDVKAWREVYGAILTRCNEDEKHHQTLMYLRNKAAGKIRVFLSDSPVGMTRPLKVDEDMYIETHYGSETMMHILVERILKPAGVDYSKIKIVITDK